jgi:hypothetical protein
MATFLDGKQWRYRRVVTLRDGARVRVSGTPKRNTKADAEYAERCAIEDALLGRTRLGRPLVAGEARSITIKLRVSPTEFNRLHRHMRRKGHSSISDTLREELKHLLGVDHG